MNYFLGIDPAWKTLGWSLIDEDRDYIDSGVLDPSKMKSGEVPEVLSKLLPHGDILGCCMERFVYYKGVHNPDSERILMVIGQLQHWLHINDIPVTLFKAFDWKSRLSKDLYKNKDFRNPSDRLDKEYSLAAAEAALGVEFKTDHEADAGCLAYIARKMTYA